MSQSFNCHCAERKKPVIERAWFVCQRNEQRSAFNGYHPQYSEHSTVVCGQCRATGRTKASYVSLLPDAPANWPQEHTFTREQLGKLTLKLAGFTARSTGMVGGDNEHALSR